LAVLKIITSSATSQEIVNW